MGIYICKTIWDFSELKNVHKFKMTFSLSFIYFANLLFINDLWRILFSYIINYYLEYISHC